MSSFVLRVEAVVETGFVLEEEEEEALVGAEEEEEINELSCDVNSNELVSGISRFCFLVGLWPYRFGSWGIFYSY